ncbi:Cation/H(+) antiporter 15 [Asimina triloba]
MSSDDEEIVCYAPTMVLSNGLLGKDNPLSYAVPLFIVQLTLIILATRAVVFILKPLRQPRVISEILGGLALGPSGLGRSRKFSALIFPLRSVAVLETVANLGLLFFLFLVGIEMDIGIIRRSGRKALTIALAGMILPFLIGIITTNLFFKDYLSKDGVNQGSFLLFLGVALSITAFPVLARILAELKLLNTDLGKIAMSSAIINDMCAWVLLALAIALTEGHTEAFTSLWIVLSGSAFVVFCVLVVRPAIIWIIGKIPEGEELKEAHLCIILTGVMMSGFITDMIGIHAIFGAFVFGLIIPQGPLGMMLIDKLEDFVSGLLLPLFFAISGLRANVAAIEDYALTVVLLVVVLVACVGKVFGTVVVSVFYGMPFREGLSLGMLMNTKGLVEMIVLNVGRDQKVIDEQTFAIMVLMAVIMTGIITPIVTAIYRPARRFIPYKRRTIQRSRADGELRILTCIHTTRNVPTIINLIDAANPAKRTPIFVYALHLIELTGRASAMLIVHTTRKPSSHRIPLNRTQAQSDHIVSAFEHYQHHTPGVAIQPLTAISPHSTMYKDVCDLAEDKRVALLLLPFHKQQTVDGGMEITNHAYRSINQNVLANAPCSVGILVDRGLGGVSKTAAGHPHHHVVVLFFGGPDDREALAFGSRMAESPSVTITVVRFFVGDNPVDPALLTRTTTKTPAVVNTTMQKENEEQEDDDCVSQFRLRFASDESAKFMEKKSNNAEETVAGIRALEVADLFLVGRAFGAVSPLTAGLMDWSECPELGAIADVLLCSDFAAHASVLVIQQYAETAAPEAAPSSHSDNRSQASEHLLANDGRSKRHPMFSASHHL